MGMDCLQPDSWAALGPTPYTSEPDWSKPSSSSSTQVPRRTYLCSGSWSWRHEARPKSLLLSMQGGTDRAAGALESRQSHSSIWLQRLHHRNGDVWRVVSGPSRHRCGRSHPLRTLAAHRRDGPGAAAVPTCGSVNVAGASGRGHRPAREMPAASEFGSEQGVLPAEFVRGFAREVGEDVQREDATETVDDRCCSVGRVPVEVDDRARQPANCVLRVPHERRWLAVQPGRFEERRGDVVDSWQPLVCVVPVFLAVELERTMAPVQDDGAILLHVLEQLVYEPGVAGRGQHVEHVDRDAEGRACGNAGREHGDRPIYPMILIAFRQSLTSLPRCVVVVGELLARPAPCELVVVGAEITHRTFGEHDGNAGAP